MTAVVRGLFAIVSGDRFVINGDGYPMVFTCKDEAHVCAARASHWCVVPLIAATPSPPREAAWGPGQFDDLTIGQGAQVSLRITPHGRVHMLVPGGDHDITEVAAMLGIGLHEASARAAQVRTRAAERTQRQEERGRRPRAVKADL